MKIKRNKYKSHYLVEVPDKPGNAGNAQSKPRRTSSRRITTDVPSPKRLALVSGIGVFILITGVAAIQSFSPKAALPDPVPEITTFYVPPPPKPTTVPSRLTGRQIEPAVAARPVTAVMIENSIDARPQAGLSEADVVFEAIAEGGITRFLALYQESQPQHIGPIRSARPYYVRWAAGFDASYAHSGGSSEGLALIRSLGVNDMDHGNYDTYFERVSNRYAPHNVYTNMGLLDSLRDALGYTTSDFTGFTRITPPTEEDEDGIVANTAATTGSLVFNVSSPSYNSAYTYDPVTNTYDRTMAGVPHTDERSGTQISPSVVIALEAGYGTHPNGIHSVYNIIGTGVATVFQNGEAIQGTWNKPSDAAELTFTTAAGTHLRYNLAKHGLLQSNQAATVTESS